MSSTFDVPRLTTHGLIAGALALTAAGCLTPDDYVVTGGTEGRWPVANLTFTRLATEALMAVHVSECKADGACTLQWMRERAPGFCIETPAFGCLAARDYDEVFDPRHADQLVDALAGIDWEHGPSACVRVTYWRISRTTAGARWSATDGADCVWGDQIKP